jgi:hypothetical protein
MAISPYSTPAQQQTIKLQDYTPVEMMGRVMDKLDARQAEGLAAMDKLDALKYDLSQKVLTSQQPLVDQALKSVNARIDEMAKSGDYIDAMPEVRRMANRVTQTMGVFNQNYDSVAATKKMIAEANEKRPGAYTDVDINEMLTKPMATLATDPTARFQAPTIGPRTDYNKLLDDLYKNLTPDSVVEVTDENGFLVKQTVKSLSREKLREAGLRILQNDANYMQGINRDYNSMLEQSAPDPERFMESAKADYATQRAAILEDTETSDEFKAKQVALIDGEIAKLEQSDPAQFMRSAFFNEELGNAVEPYAVRAFTQTDVDTKVNPYRLEDYRQNNRMAMLREQEKVAERKARTDASNSEKGLYWMSSLGRSPMGGIAPGTNISSMIQKGEADIKTLQTQIANAQDPGVRQQLMAQYDELATSLSTSMTLQQEVAASLGLSVTDIQALEAGMPQPPIGMSLEDLKKVKEYAAKGPQLTGGAGLAPTGRDLWEIGLSTEGKQYYSAYREWHKNLSTAKRDSIDKVQEALQERFDKRGSHSVPVFALTGERKTAVAAMVNDITGTRVFEGTPEDGKELTEDKPDITEVTSVTTVPLGMPDGTMAYRIHGRDKNGKVYTMVVSDSDNFRDWLGRVEPEGQAINRTQWGMRLHGLGDGLSMQPMINGENPFGPGGTIVRRQNNFEVTWGDGTKRTIPLERLILDLETERRKAYGEEGQ